MTGMLRRVTQSRANYRLAHLIDFLCPLAFAYAGWHHAPPWPQTMIGLAAGALAFSFVEYAIHRWLFHSPASFMAPFHHAHHASPHDPTALPSGSSAVVGVLLWPLAARATGPGVAAFLLCGFFGWYCLYGALHHLEHHTHINRLPLRWLQRRWANHAVHHRRVDANFGVTTQLWDHVFGTHYQSGPHRDGAPTRQSAG
jgi:sterol desaturase/sphingolipid hydroxylase (fatty acid hydroxylase superfamily)